MGVLSPEHPENGKTPAPSSITDPECPPHALPRQLPVQGPAGGQPRAGKAELVGRGGEVTGYGLWTLGTKEQHK